MSERTIHPALSEQGKIEAEQIIEHFKAKMQKVCEETLGQIYTSIPVWIETDSWTNFRNDALDGFQDYRNRFKHGDYDFKRIRQQIFMDFRDEIIKDLDQDNLKEIERLKERINWLEEMRR